MLLYLTTIDKERQFREFFVLVSSLEKALDFLSLLVSLDSILIKAELVENGKRMELPVEAFDGHLVSPVIQTLEAEWHQVLDAPVAVEPVPDEWLARLIQQRNECQIDRIFRLEHAIETFEQQLQCFYAHTDGTAEPLTAKRSATITRLIQSIELYRRHLADAQASQKRDYLQRLQTKLRSVA